jgi:hypothetical protein
MRCLTHLPLTIGYAAAGLPDFRHRCGGFGDSRRAGSPDWLRYEPLAAQAFRPAPPCDLLAWSAL